MYKEILFEIDGDGVVLITLSRPEQMNAFTVSMCAELIDAFSRASADDSIKAVVVTGAGKAFCGGMDLSSQGNVFGLNESIEANWDSLVEGWNDPAIKTGVRDLGGQLALAIRACRKPVLAAINGVAVGIGATMTCAMDIRMAAPEAKIGFVFGRIGITPEACSTWYLPRLVGMQQTLEWFYIAEPFPAEEGLRAGLLRSLHARDSLVGEAKALARRMTGNRSMAATAITRDMVYRSSGDSTPLRAHIAESLAIHWLSQRSGKEGVAAFREKRSPVFEQTLGGALPHGFPWHDKEPGNPPGE